MPSELVLPSDSTKRVNYAVVVGTETAFPPNQNVKLDEITDGLENTILVVETLSGSDKWTEPRDLQFDSMSFVISKSKNGEIGSKHPSGAYAGFADGEVHFITDAISPEELRALLTIAGNEPFTRQQLIDRGVIRKPYGHFLSRTRKRRASRHVWAGPAKSSGILQRPTLARTAHRRDRSFSGLPLKNP